ncbi:hypothetical protein [Mesorhizobium sp. B2-8-5]|uniref:hypothetical protein n=1 Tax=Mesorhizobium sp. B2-8-5 TaxID=2589903 RepID=UPI00112BE96F|nr:hypothetical protein [Mesorhizobium sp. B2-8-5]UCI23972.1 hypothetical protein FJ430_20455 [Mesorhizobium sp. B2-8-5]
MMIYSGWQLCLILACLSISDIARAETVSLTIETRIKEKTLSFEAGIKSTQTVVVDFSMGSVSSSFTTGVTSIGVSELKSIRDAFSVDNVAISKTAAGFDAVGQTASGVGFMPNIDYKFAITVDVSSREVVFSGCHDGYPSYKIFVNGNVVYDFDQELLVALFGSCDTKVQPTTVKF